MSNVITMRRPICAEDAPEVWELFAKLLTDYARLIEKDVVEIVGRHADPDFQAAAARCYATKIAWNVPDSTIKAALEKLAISKFRQAGVAV